MLYVALFGLIAVAGADRLAQSNRLTLNTYDYFAASRTHETRFEHYESQREAGESYRSTPSIQSDIIRDPYVKLFIPYWPQRHNAAIRRACPDLKVLQKRGMQVGADPLLGDSLITPVLACLARIHDVKLDGAPQSLTFAFYENPRSGLKGILAYLPADSLARGRHVITVMPVPPPKLPTDSTRLANAWWKQPYQIPFWR